jgi:CheY-like chemotaxis protein
MTGPGRRVTIRDPNSPPGQRNARLKRHWISGDGLDIDRKVHNMSNDGRPRAMPGDSDNGDAHTSLSKGMELSVLLIDDMKSLLTILQSGLRQHGHIVFTAQSGKEGVETFSTNRIDVIICDLGMDGMDGWEVGRNVREICEQSGREKPPFILMTGWGADVSDDELFSCSGVDMVLEKPVELPNLIQLLRDVVAERVSGDS